METDQINTVTALRYLKAGYHLALVSKNRENFYFKDNQILIKDENKSLLIKEYDFLSLYGNSFFYLVDDDKEEAVDPKKDEEYYSWRQ